MREREGEKEREGRMNTLKEDLYVGEEKETLMGFLGSFRAAIF